MTYIQESGVSVLERPYKSFNSFLTEMSLPVALSPPKTTKDIPDYRAQLKACGAIVGKGSSRVVVKVIVDGQESVLKIALNANGFKQNQNEKELVEKFGHLFLTSHNPLLTLIDDYSNYHGIAGVPLWLQFEVVKPFKKNQYLELERHFSTVYGDFTKLPGVASFLNKERPDSTGMKKFGFEFCFLNSFRRQLTRKPTSFSDEQWRNILSLYSFIDKSKTSIHDLRMPENWGITLDSNQLKIIDLGFSDEFCKQTKPLKIQNSNGVISFKP